MEKRWVIKPEEDPDIVARLQQELGVDEYLATLLAQRGIAGHDPAKAFFRPSLEDLHDPFLMKDMERAVIRVEEALEEGERIMVYGDYDVDGTTSVAMVYAFLRHYSNNIEYYVPDRYREGYGISYEGIETAAGNGVSLIIALDCGIKALDQAAEAKRQDIDLIVCDHHRPGKQLPDAYAILDPQREDCSYPYKGLSGCGVGFKLLQALVARNDISFEVLTEFLDLVAVSIAADIVPITEENRVLVYYGLDRINTSPRAGFRAILENLDKRREKPLTVSDLVFIIGPRVNAAGRIDSGNRAVEFLIAANEEEASAPGKLINSHNDQRRELDRRITCEALDMIETDETLQKAYSTVVFQEDWHKGVIGIVASRLIEHYYRPTIVLTEFEGKVSGSARSVKGFDVYEAIEACGEWIEQFGGHKYAAGLTLRPEHVEPFRQKFEEEVAATIREEQLTPQVELDLELPLRAITQRFYRILRQFAPFGPGNLKPVFYTPNVVDIGNVRVVGEDHLKMTLQQKGDAGSRLPAIAFGWGDYFERVRSGEPFHIAYQVDENEFRGKTTLQLKIKDMKFGVQDPLNEKPARAKEIQRNPLDQSS